MSKNVGKSFVPLLKVEALARGSHAILRGDKAHDLGYEGGNVKVRVEQVRNRDSTVFIGFPDGREAWVNAKHLHAAVNRPQYNFMRLLHLIQVSVSEIVEVLEQCWKHLVRDIRSEHAPSRSLDTCVALSEVHVCWNI